jgi:peptidoglycan hydrolase-like protein with peptidoglycan-binding domain
MKKGALLLALMLAAYGAGSVAVADQADTAAQTTPEATAQADAAETDAAQVTQAPDTADAQYQALERGAKGEDVRALMQRLYDLGYYKSDVDDTFGKGMARAVRLFNVRCGLGSSEVASVETQQLAFAANAPVYDIMPPRITGVRLEQYEGKPVFSITAYNPQESDITFLSVIFRCYDANGAQIYATAADAFQLINEPKFGKYRDIKLASGETLDMSTLTSFDLSAYPGVSRVDVAVYCYQAGRDIMIVPESYFTWVSSDGTTTGDEISQSAIALRNRTSEQDKQASRFDLGISTEHVYAYESDYYGVPVGMYLNSVEPSSIAANAGLQAGDVITAIAGIPLDFDEALYIIKAQMEPGVEYALDYSRAGVTNTTMISWTETADAE